MKEFLSLWGFREVLGIFPGYVGKIIEPTTQKTNHPRPHAFHPGHLLSTNSQSPVGQITPGALLWTLHREKGQLKRAIRSLRTSVFSLTVYIIYDLVFEQLKGPAVRGLYELVHPIHDHEC